MNISAISRNIGIVLLINAFFMLLCLVASIFSGIDSSFSPLLLSAIITLVVGAFPVIFVRHPSHVNTREGFVIAVLSWVVSCIFGMLPFVLWGGEFSLVNAWFESVSGYTTTGATILTDVEALPNGLLLWRSSTHFMGGTGVVLFILLLPSMSTSRMRLSRVEISSLSKENFNYKTSQMIRVIVWVYASLAFLEVVALMLAGMNFFDALNHSFSTVATGGFSTKNNSIQYYQSPGIELIIMIFMFLSGLHFGLLYSFFVNRKLKLFKSPIVKFYLLTTVVAGVLITLNLIGSGTIKGFWEAVRHAFFQVVSMITTTGFGSADSTTWPPFSIVILIYLSVQCACSGSTTGGLKSDRICILFASIKSQLKRKLHPNAVIPARVGTHIIEPETVSGVTQFISLYIFVLFVGTLFMTLSGLDILDSFTSVVACLGNVGPGFGTAGALDNFNHFPAFSKMGLSLLMLMGRVEIYSILVIFFLFNKKWA